MKMKSNFAIAVPVVPGSVMTMSWWTDPLLVLSVRQYTQQQGTHSIDVEMLHVLVVDGHRVREMHVYRSCCLVRIAAPGQLPTP